MGCCETHDTSSLLSPYYNSKSSSILLTEKRPSKGNKKVTFDISFTNYRHLDIKEDSLETIPWYYTELQIETSQWQMHNDSKGIKIKYQVVDDKLYANTMIILKSQITYEDIICLINNPKYRMKWDTDMLKMEILFGDANLDSTLSMSKKTYPSAQLFDRVVRKYRDLYIISFVPYEDALKDNYFLIVIFVNCKLEIFYKESAKDLRPSMENKFLWAQRLNDELIAHGKH